MQNILYRAFSFPRLHGGTCWRGRHLPGWLHCEEAEPPLPWHHPLLYALCPDEPCGRLRLLPTLPQCTYGWSDHTIPEQLSKHQLLLYTEQVHDPLAAGAPPSTGHVR